LNLVFLINLFRDTNVTRIFYKSSQTCGMHANGNIYLGTGEYLCKLSFRYESFFIKKKKGQGQTQIRRPSSPSVVHTPSLHNVSCHPSPEAICLRLSHSTSPPPYPVSHHQLPHFTTLASFPLNHLSPALDLELASGKPPPPWNISGRRRCPLGRASSTYGSVGLNNHRSFVVWTYRFLPSFYFWSLLQFKLHMMLPLMY
jgi:hypothetical protein